MQIPIDKIAVQKLVSPLYNGYNIDVLRLDELHPIVSGNKWFKLKYHLQEAKKFGFTTIATFGGAFSNHIVATAFACQLAGLRSIGIIRGEEPKKYSATLLNAMQYGMQLQFVSRKDFQEKAALQKQFDDGYFWVNEGGYSTLGMLGAKEILSVVDTTAYTHIICSCGTGTMMAGLVAAALPHQQIIGISALKGNDDAEKMVLNLLPEALTDKPFTILHNYHFGGYAKHPPELIEWMNLLSQEEQLPTDIVYTSKLLFAVKDLCEQDFFSKQVKLLVIHSGGLQGNLSLPPNTLHF